MKNEKHVKHPRVSRIPHLLSPTKKKTITSDYPSLTLNAKLEITDTPVLHTELPAVAASAAASAPDADSSASGDRGTTDAPRPRWR